MAEHVRRTSDLERDLRSRRRTSTKSSSVIQLCIMDPITQSFWKVARLRFRTIWEETPTASVEAEFQEDSSRSTYPKEDSK